MTKYEVQFTIEAKSLGDATNRALVALYKGELDAEEVNVVAKGGGDKYKTFGEDNDDSVTIRTPAPHPGAFPGTGIKAWGGVVPPDQPTRGDYKSGGMISEFTIVNPPTSMDVEALKKKIQNTRGKIVKEPNKDALD